MLTLAFGNDVIPVVAIVGGITIALVSIVFGAVKSMIGTRAREATKREIAAYVAEGSISPEDAERLIKADTPRPPGCGM